MARVRPVLQALLVATAVPACCLAQGLGDVATQERQQRIEALPPAIGELKAGFSRYSGVLRVQGQTHNVELSTEVRDTGRTWVLREAWQIDGGPVDAATSELEKGSLNVLRHRSENGSVRREYEVREGVAIGRLGTVAFGPFKEAWKPLLIKLEGPLFADGGAPLAVASLPLADGYSREVWNLDFAQSRSVHKTLSVVGREQVAVPAGRFFAWRVEIASAERGVRSTTVWVDVQSRRVLRIHSPAANGGPDYTVELQR